MTFKKIDLDLDLSEQDDVGIADEVMEYVEEVKGYVSTTRGKPMLVDQRNYTYHVNNKSPVNNRIWWKCSKFKTIKCPARAVTFHNKITKLSGIHSHEPDLFTQKIV